MADQDMMEVANPEHMAYQGVGIRFVSLVIDSIIRIKVVREDGRPIDMNQALTRNILRIIDGFIGYLIGAILIWRSDKKQRLGDRWAKTVVVKA